MDFNRGDKIATREGYGKSLVELADTLDFVVLDADLAEATKTCYFAKAHPERFFDCGIAEANMVGIAAGPTFCWAGAHRSDAGIVSLL